MMAYEQAKSLLFKALCEYKIDPASAETTIHALKVLIDRNSKFIYGEAIQDAVVWVLPTSWISATTPSA